MSLIVTPRELTRRSELYQQLASLMSAGVAMIQALEMIRRNPPARSFRQPLTRLIASVTQGATLTEALLGLGRWLPSFDLALIQAAAAAPVAAPSAPAAPVAARAPAPAPPTPVPRAAAAPAPRPASAPRSAPVVMGVSGLDKVLAMAAALMGVIVLIRVLML